MKLRFTVLLVVLQALFFSRAQRTDVTETRMGENAVLDLPQKELIILTKMTTVPFTRTTIQLMHLKQNYSTTGITTVKSYIWSFYHITKESIRSGSDLIHIDPPLSSLSGRKLQVTSSNLTYWHVCQWQDACNLPCLNPDGLITTEPKSPTVEPANFYYYATITLGALCCIFLLIILIQLLLQHMNGRKQTPKDVPAMPLRKAPDPSEPLYEDVYEEPLYDN